MSETEILPDEKIDITDVTCPITFVKTKVALDELENGQILQVHLNGGEPIQNVPRSVKDEGHTVLKVPSAFSATLRTVWPSSFTLRGTF